MTAPTCMCIVSVSSARKVASTPLRRSTTGPRRRVVGLGGRGARGSSAPTACDGGVGSSTGVAEATQAPGGVGELTLGDGHELGLLDGLDHELGDAVTATHLVGGRGVGVHEQDA